MSITYKELHDFEQAMRENGLSASGVGLGNAMGIGGGPIPTNVHVSTGQQIKPKRPAPTPIRFGVTLVRGGYLVELPDGSLAVAVDLEAVQAMVASAIGDAALKAS